MKKTNHAQVCVQRCSRQKRLFDFSKLFYLFLFTSMQCAAGGVLHKIKLADHHFTSQAFVTSNDGHWAYVSSSFNDSASYQGELYLVDLTQKTVSKRIHFPTHHPLGNLYLSQDNKKLYLFYVEEPKVTGGIQSGVDIIDTQTFKTISSIRFNDNDYVFASTLSGDHSKLYVALQSRRYIDGRMAVIDTDLDQIVDEFSNPDPATNSMLLLIDPNGKTLYQLPYVYTNLGRYDSTLYALDIETKAVNPIGKLPVMCGQRLSISSDGKTFYESGYEKYIINSSDQEPHDYYVYAIDKNTMASKELFYSEQPVYFGSLSNDINNINVIDGHGRRNSVKVINNRTGAIEKIIYPYGGIIRVEESPNPDTHDVYILTKPYMENGNLFLINSEE